MKKIKYLSTVVCIILIAIYGIHLALIYKSLPETVPDHFDFAGNPNSYGNRISLIMEPLISIMIIVVMDVVSCFPNSLNYPAKVTEDNKEFLYNVTLIMVSVIKIIVTVLLMYIGLCSIYSFMPVTLVYVFVTMLLIVCFGSIFIMWRGQ